MIVEWMFYYCHFNDVIFVLVNFLFITVSNIQLFHCHDLKTRLASQSTCFVFDVSLVSFIVITFVFASSGDRNSLKTLHTVRPKVHFECDMFQEGTQMDSSRVSSNMRSLCNIRLSCFLWCNYLEDDCESLLSIMKDATFEVVLDVLLSCYALTLYHLIFIMFWCALRSSHKISGVDCC